jgi:EAL domain-containing protein (putative c-di-GMP-specific phosphodiesterase class I)
VLQKPLRVAALRAAFRSIYDSSGALSTEDLNKGISNNEFRLEYQPQVDLKSGDVVGFEALARWDHPRMGAVSPARFIPVLETSDAIDEFTLHVIEKAVTDMRAWNGTIKARVAINLSAANFKNLDIHDIVRSKCNRRGVDINRITIEITESAAMAVSGTITKRLESLSALGAHVSIDDFGTGYSSIGSLHALPFSELKIDRSFVYDCVSDSDRGIVVQSMINLGHNLRKSVVAEGVETIDTMDRLRSWTCDIAQGFFISKPMPPESVEGWVESYSKNAAA